ncbi:MAG: arylesterase [Wenzhouxiangella sp.]|jgi:acyl-CoA thioesterase-1|nr:arylesterase [Wenzhouxiangella sp.]
MKFQNALIAALVALLAVLSCPAAHATERLLILGDSLSDAYGMPRESGWSALLQDRLGDQMEVINASISGETTAGGLTRIEGLLNQHEPERLLVILGGNDGLRALNPSQVERNLQGIIDHALQADTEVALMQVRLPPNLGPAYLRRFEGIYPRLAEINQLTLFPFFLEGVFDQPGMMMDDGIHPSAAAQGLMLDALWPALAQWLDVESG